MNNCEFITLISSIACAIAKDKTTEEINLLSSIFSQLGSTLMTIASLQDCNSIIDNNSNCDNII